MLFRLIDQPCKYIDLYSLVHVDLCDQSSEKQQHIQLVKWPIRDAYLFSPKFD